MIEGVLDELESERTSLTTSEAGKEDAEEDEEEEREEDALKLHQVVEESEEVHPETEGVGEEHPLFSIITSASIQDPSHPEVSHALTSSAAPESCSSSSYPDRTPTPRSIKLLKSSILRGATSSAGEF